jgi:uncharacterized YccA/Bax inhibitor family protein
MVSYFNSFELWLSENKAIAKLLLIGSALIAVLVIVTRFGRKASPQIYRGEGTGFIKYPIRTRGKK